MGTPIVWAVDHCCHCCSRRYYYYHHHHDRRWPRPPLGAGKERRSAAPAGESFVANHHAREAEPFGPRAKGLRAHLAQRRRVAPKSDECRRQANWRRRRSPALGNGSELQLIAAPPNANQSGAGRRGERICEIPIADFRHAAAQKSLSRARGAFLGRAEPKSRSFNGIGTINISLFHGGSKTMMPMMRISRARSRSSLVVRRPSREKLIVYGLSSRRGPSARARQRLRRN